MARPREFDADEALDKAMHQFWAKGYHDTSIRDLVACTGVNYYGLYGVFENKHGLFLAALDRYSATVTTEITKLLKHPGPALQAIESAFDRLIELLTGPDSHVGCMMCNTAIELAPYDPTAAAKFQAHMKRLRDAFQAKLSQGQEAGEFGQNKDAGALAEFLTTTAYAVGLLLRADCGNAYVQRHIRSALSAIE